MRDRARLFLLAGIAVLFVISVPWYRSAGEAPELWWGLPDWVAVAVACYVAIAVLNAAAWALTDIPEPSDPGAARGARAEPGADPSEPQ